MKFVLLIFLIPVLGFANKIILEEPLTSEINYINEQKRIYKLEDDKRNTLTNLKNQIEKWQLNEEYSHYFGMDKTGLNFLTDEESKESHVLKNLGRYAEKRAQLIIDNRRGKKQASKFSIGDEQENSPTQDTNKITYKLNTNPTKGRLRLNLINPYLEMYTQYSVFSGKEEICLSKNFKDINFKTSYLFSILANTSSIMTEKKLTETISAKFTNTNFSESKYELIYSYFF